MALVTPEEVAAKLRVPATDPTVIAAASAADTLITAQLIPGPHEEHPADKLAALTVAIDIYQNTTAPGGEIVGPDYQPLPYRMGGSLLTRVSGLITLCATTEVG